MGWSLYLLYGKMNIDGMVFLMKLFAQTMIARMSFYIDNIRPTERVPVLMMTFSDTGTVSIFVIFLLFFTILPLQVHC